MRLDLSIIENEAINNFEKKALKARDKFLDLLSIALDAAVNEIDKDKRERVQLVVEDELDKEVSKCIMIFRGAISRAANQLEERLQ